MSFVVVYNIPGKSSIPHHYLTGIIGSDCFVYWLCKDVAAVLGYSRSYARRLSDKKVRDVTGPLDNVGPDFLRKRIISHFDLSFLLKKARRSTVRDFERKINSPGTRVAVNPGGNVTNLKDPTYVVITETKENHRSFFLWLETFKVTAFENLYGMPVLDDSFVPSFIEHAAEPPETIPENFPPAIFYKCNGRTIKYLPEP